MAKYLPLLPSDEELAGKKIMLVAEDFETGKFINAHTNVRKFCNFYKQVPKDPNRMIDINVFVNNKSMWGISAYYGTMHYYCLGSRTFGEMADAMRQHCRDNDTGKKRF